MFFQSLLPLLSTCASLTTSMVANEDGTLTVMVIPKAKKDDHDNASLNTPLTLTGTASELDAEFSSLLSSYSSKRKSLSEQLDATAAILDAAKKESAAKSAKNTKPTKQAPSVSLGDGNGELDEKPDSPSEGANNNGAVSTNNLWG